MTWQRTIGIDLALEGKHAAIVCNERAEFVQTKQYSFTSDLSEMENLITSFIPEHMNKEEVAVVMEPTSNAWVIVSSFFLSRGFRVFVVKTQKIYALRQYFKKHAKTDMIDAKTLAKMPFVDSDHLTPLVVSPKDYFSLGKLIKLRDSIVSTISMHKNRIYAHFQLLNPKLMALLSDNKFTALAKAFYRRYANPLQVKKDGFGKMSSYLEKHAFGTPDQELLQKIFDVSISIAQLHDDITHHNEFIQLPYDMDTLQEIVHHELDIIEFFDEKQKELEKEIEKVYTRIDPEKILAQIKGLGGNIIAPALIAFTGSIKRFKNMRNYISYIGLVPKIKQSVGPQQQGMSITKAGQQLLKKYYCLAADTARRFDVQFAHKYYVLTSRGLHHNQAICALANMVARRVYSLLKRTQEAYEKNDQLKLKSIHYEFRDLNHKRISAVESYHLRQVNYPNKKEKQRLINKKKEKVAQTLCLGSLPNVKQSLTPVTPQ